MIKNSPVLKLITRRIIFTSYSFLMLLLVPACQSSIFEPPRLAAELTRQPTPLIATSEAVFLPAPTATAVVGEAQVVVPPRGPNPSLTVWVNESSDEHAEAVQLMMDEFEQEQQVDIELVLIVPALLPKLINTAVVSDTLPDIVLHPLRYTAGWAKRSILDASTTNEIIDEIGRDTFDPDALELVTLDGLAAAIPSDGYQQLLIYRTDWLNGLEPPDDYDAMMEMAAAMFNQEAVISGLVIPTESNLVGTHHAFEHIATANGCQLIDEKGEVLILEPQCQEALDFYLSIVSQYSPIGVQTVTSARNAYLSGRTSMIMTSPTILPMLAGLDSHAKPTCIECENNVEYLANNSGLITHLNGYDPVASGSNFGQITLLGITPKANKEIASAFAQYWFNQGYETWLSIESERKVPMRWGTLDQPRKFIDAWGTQPLAGTDRSLVDIFGQAVVNDLRQDIAKSDRWGFRQGQSRLITSLHEEFILPVILQEMLSGYFNSNQTLIEMYQRITDLIPNYEYHVDIETGTESEE